jgi:AcrR family transcriptional regulator
MTEGQQVDPRGRRRQAKLSAILAEAWALAHRDGLAVISLRDLADRVDLRQPSLYAYFDSKLGLYDLMFADGNRQLLERVRSLSLSDDQDVVRHQLLFQRTIPGFEPSAASYALALEFYEIARQRLSAAGVSDPSDLDVFSALVNGLAHQQVANDPGGDRWVRLAQRAVEMFLADVDRHRQQSTHKGKRP